MEHNPSSWLPFFNLHFPPKIIFCSEYNLYSCYNATKQVAKATHIYNLTTFQYSLSEE